MRSKRGLLKESRLYVIIDKKVCAYKPLFDIANKIKNSGADIIQYRDKFSNKESILENAFNLNKLFKKSKSIFIINDYLDIAKIIDSDGLHLGQDDLSIEIARKILGKDKIIGISCHNLEQALDAQDRGADYIGVGPVFESPTKIDHTNTISLDLIKNLKKLIRIPFFVIGGINEDNIRQALLAGAKRVAVCRAICQSKNIPVTIKNFSRLLY